VLHEQGPVHNKPDKFENGVFTLKTHEMFFIHTTPEIFKNATVILDLCLKKTPAGKSPDYREVIAFEKAPFLKRFFPHENEKLAFLNSSGLKSVFEKLRFNVDSGPNRGNKTAFSISPA